MCDRFYLSATRTRTHIQPQYCWVSGPLLAHTYLRQIAQIYNWWKNFTRSPMTLWTLGSAIFRTLRTDFLTGPLCGQLQISTACTNNLSQTLRISSIPENMSPVLGAYFVCSMRACKQQQDYTWSVDWVQLRGYHYWTESANSGNDTQIGFG